MKLTFEDIRNNEEIKVYIKQADMSLVALGYTEHSFAHVTKCALVAGEILSQLGYDERTIELAKIAAYMHDIGNVINRVDHAQSGAVMAFRILDKLGMPAEDISAVITAIGNHDEHTAYPVNAIAAALILADKCDVRRSRVRNPRSIAFDIHDRVNYAVEKADLVTDKEECKIVLKLEINTEICAVIDYFEIFMERMLLCRKAADFFKMHFSLEINGQAIM
ncbi:MAG: HD domain-containing protein [Paludibacteraceae bacterium]|nr:HD domain-containing protein [Paludibacteraceae bacterium]